MRGLLRPAAHALRAGRLWPGLRWRASRAAAAPKAAAVQAAARSASQPPKCGHVRCRKKLVKKEITCEVPVYKCVVEYVCCDCCGPSCGVCTEPAAPMPTATGAPAEAPIPAAPIPAAPCPGPVAGLRPGCQLIAPWALDHLDCFLTGRPGDARHPTAGLGTGGRVLVFDATREAASEATPCTDPQLGASWRSAHLRADPSTPSESGVQGDLPWRADACSPPDFAADGGAGVGPGPCCPLQWSL